MDRLPTEIMDHILGSACVDDGRTGCALSIVSRFIRRASARMRYHSVALRGPKQIRAFIELMSSISMEPSWLQSQSTHGSQEVRPVPVPIVIVRHLFLADCMGSHNGVEPLWKEWSQGAGTHDVCTEDATDTESSDEDDSDSPEPGTEAKFACQPVHSQ
jgi:hypothetical protein